LPRLPVRRRKKRPARGLRDPQKVTQNRASTKAPVNDLHGLLD